MQEPPPPESIASMWPVLVSAAEDGLRRAQSTSAEQERIRREGHRSMSDIFRFFQSHDESEVGASVEQCFVFLDDQAHDAFFLGYRDETGADNPEGPSRAGIHSAVKTLCDEGRMYQTIDDQHFKTTPGGMPDG